MNNFKYLSLLQDYHNDRLSPEAKQDFEHQCRNNPELAAEWKAYQTIVRAAQEKAQADDEIAALQKQLEAEGFFDDVHAAIQQKQQTRELVETPANGLKANISRNLLYRRLAVAATFLLAVAGFWLFNKTFSWNDETAQYLPLPSNATQGFSADNDTLILVQQKLTDHKTDEALALLKAMRPPISDDGKYLFAWVWFEKGNYDETLLKINELYNDGNNRQSIHPDILWRAELLEAKAFFKKGDRKKALFLLDSFIKTDAEIPEKQMLINAAKSLRQQM